MPFSKPIRDHSGVPGAEFILNNIAVAAHSRAHARECEKNEQSCYGFSKTVHT
jgi:hypothetical protein